MIKQLARLRGKFDMNVVMERRNDAGWIGFYSTEYQPSQANTYQEQKHIQAVQKEIQEQHRQRESQAPPRSETKKEEARKNVAEMMVQLNKAKKW